MKLSRSSAALGFAVAEGPEIETEFHCFRRPQHSGRIIPHEMRRTPFIFETGELLRTHTSSVQIRTMETAEDTPLRIIAPGSAFRRDEIDATHLSSFNQLEGLYVDEKSHPRRPQGNLGILFPLPFWPKRLRSDSRPHFFPFTEPSYEIDIRLEAKGKQPKWIEIAGCGIVDPAVFEARLPVTRRSSL